MINNSTPINAIFYTDKVMRSEIIEPLGPAPREGRGAWPPN